MGDAVLDKVLVKDKAVGDIVEAILYHDRNQVLRASLNFPFEIGTIHSLQAVDVDKKGVYFKIKENRNIFMPFEERTYKVLMDMTYPVAFKENKNGYVYLTSKIRELLSNEHSYRENDEVSGRIYSINKSIGAFIALEDKYDALLRMNELRGVHIEGELIEARVKEVKADGKIELSLRQRAYLQMDADSDRILDYLYDNGGVVNISDKSSPDKIYKVFNMSKAAYKRALGRLYKNNDIIIYNNRIELKEGINGRKK